MAELTFRPLYGRKEPEVRDGGYTLACNLRVLPTACVQYILSLREIICWGYSMYLPFVCERYKNYVYVLGALIPLPCTSYAQPRRPFQQQTIKKGYFCVSVR